MIAKDVNVERIVEIVAREVMIALADSEQRSISDECDHCTEECTGEVCVKTCFDRVLLVGDAACQIKPWSCGGVIYSLTAAEIAAKTIKQAKQANDFSEAFLKKYEHGWKAAFGKQISTGMIGRTVFKRMGNMQLDIAMRGMRSARFLMNKLDMDFLMKK